jgi:CIC family chloride channel protein
LQLPVGQQSRHSSYLSGPYGWNLFAVEVLLFDLEIASLSNIVISAVTGTMVARAFWEGAQVFEVPDFFMAHPAELLLYFFLGLVAGLISLVLMGAIFSLEVAETSLLRSVKQTQLPDALLRQGSARNAQSRS